ncbi:MAG: Heme/hemopexin-binding protein precursor, partial [Pseudomonadota bacterium]
MNAAVDLRTLRTCVRANPPGAVALDTCGRSLGLLAATIVVSLSSAPSWASVLPEGGQITLGQATLTRTGDQLIIEQKTRDLSATWQSFSIGQGNKVTFKQPSVDAVAVNRVLGSDVSAIQGALESNGKVFLINPNGILFSKTAQVNVGALVASTLELGE